MSRRATVTADGTPLVLTPSGDIPLEPAAGPMQAWANPGKLDNLGERVAPGLGWLERTCLVHPEGPVRWYGPAGSTCWACP